MSNSSLIDILNSIEKTEQRKLRKFIISPYYNSNDNVVRLYDYLIVHKNNESNLPTNQELHKLLFGGTKFNNENIKTIIYLLSRLCEKFLVINTIESNVSEFDRRLLEIFDKKGLDKHFARHLKRINKNTPGKNAVEINAVYRQAEFERTLIEYYTRKNNEFEMFSHEQKLSENLIAAFFVDIFKQHNIFWRISYLEKIKIHDFTTDLLNVIDLKELFRIFKEKDFSHSDLLLPYYEIYCILKDETNSFNIHSIIEGINCNSVITENEKFVLSTILVNTLYYKNLKFENQLSRELFEAFKLLLLLYKHSGERYLRYTIFSNVLRIGLQLGEYDWTDNFIKTSHLLLEPGIKENMFNYSNAYLSFAKKDFDKCLEYESRINHDTFQQRYYLRDLRLCSLYELGKFETALSLIDSYKHFIKNDKSYTAKMKQRYLLFLGFIYDLIRIKSGVSRKNFSDIEIKLFNTQPMRKDWLLEKFAELKEKL